MIATKLRKALGECFVTLACALALASTAGAAPVISEFMASNRSTLADDDGDFSDWIEIHNPGEAAVDLEGWHLTDRVAQPTMWTFPPLQLEPGGHLVVFASGKDRRDPAAPLHTNFALAAAGEYLALIAPDGETASTEFAPAFPPQVPDVSFGTSVPSRWERLLGKGSPLRWRVPGPADGPALGDFWRAPEFDDSDWAPGRLALGFKNGANDALGMRNIFETDVQAQMYLQRLTVYLRAPFELTNPAAVRRLELRTRYDDGYAAFLNGGENPVDEMNAPANLTWQSAATATAHDSDGLLLKMADLTPVIPRLRAGTNVLAVHGLNVNLTSSDLLIDPELWALLPSEDGVARTGYFRDPTPGAPNGGDDSLTLLEQVEFSLPSQTFTDTLSVALSGAGEGQVIRFTTDGSLPGADSHLYTGPLALGFTTMVRARVFDADGIGGLSDSRHYLRLASSVADLRSNLPLLVLDARGQSLNDSTRRDGSFLLFDRDEDGIASLRDLPAVATRHGIRLRGSSSLGQPKRPYSVEFWDEDDEDRRIEVLGMTAESDWVLYAPFHFDRSFMRNTVAYELSRRIGRWAPQTRFVEVYYNGNGGNLTSNDYAGVYALVERIKMSPRRLGYRTVNPEDVPPPGPIDLAATGAWTGGYVFKVDRNDPDEYEWTTPRGMPGSGGGTLVISRPKMPNMDGGPYFSRAAALAGSRQVAYLRDYFHAFENALFRDLANGFSSRDHLEFIDRDSWVDHLVLNVFTKNVDALRLSAFFHKPENGRIIAGPIWDFDRSMGSYDGRDSASSGWFGTGDATRYFEYAWWNLLMQDPDFEQAFYDRWAELRQGAFSDEAITEMLLAFGHEIDTDAHGLGSAAVRDANRWSQNRPRDNFYMSEVLHQIDWLTARAAWMDRRRRNVQLLPEAPQAVVGTDGRVSLSSVGGTVVYTLDGSDPRASGGGIAGTTYSEPLNPAGVPRLTARVRSPDGVWSTPTVMGFEEEPPGPLFLPNANGSWNEDSHWSSTPAPYPDGIGAAATVGPPAAEVDRNVELNAPVTLGRLDFPQAASAVRNRLRDRGTGNGLTFRRDGAPARLSVGGDGDGFVELEIAAGVRLESDLELVVENIAGHPEHGALRLREGWSGPGGLIKRGAGAASLTGGGKDYTGATEILEGVLQVTGPATPASTSGVSVAEGGQLRLVSASSPGEPRIHSFGGDLVLRGMGRGPEIPESNAMGRLGALRYDPGSQENHAVVTNSIELAADADIHIDGTRNLLELRGPLRGAGTLVKTGGGSLWLSGGGDYSGEIDLVNGPLILRDLEVAAHVGTDGLLDLAGAAGPLHGAGTLWLPGTLGRAPEVAVANHAFLFSRDGLPLTADPTASGNSVLFADEVAVPETVALYLTLPTIPGADPRPQGGWFLPPGHSWAPLLDGPAYRIYVPDAEGGHEFMGLRWVERHGVAITRVPATLDGGEGPREGHLLELRFDGAPIDYDGWRLREFPNPADFVNPAVSGPAATPRGDGVANLLRFALGEDGSGRARLPRLVAGEEGAVFRLPYDPGLRGLRWIVESSADPGNWEDAEPWFDSREHPAPAPADGWLELAVESADFGDARFFRLRLALEAD